MPVLDFCNPRLRSSLAHSFTSSPRPGNWVFLDHPNCRVRDTQRLYPAPRPISAVGLSVIQPPSLAWPGRVESSRAESRSQSRGHAHRGSEVSNPSRGTQQRIGLYLSFTRHCLRPHDVITTRTATQAQRRKWDHRSISTRATWYRPPRPPAITAATLPSTPILCLSTCLSASPHRLHKESSSHRRDILALGGRALSCGSCSPAQTRQVGSA